MKRRLPRVWNALLRGSIDRARAQVIADNTARQVVDAVIEDAAGLTTHQHNSVTARDRTCIFPGCRMPATNCDLDHRRPFAEHPETSTDGLAPLLRRHHHTTRHRQGWTYQPLPNGDYLWTSPVVSRVLV